MALQLSWYKSNSHSHWPVIPIFQDQRWSGSPLFSLCGCGNCLQLGLLLLSFALVKFYGIAIVPVTLQTCPKFFLSC